MKAVSIRLQNFRNHVDTSVEGLSGQINVIVGHNGAGKTSILEALALTTLSKSFSTHSDSVLIRDGAKELNVESNSTSDLGVPHRVVVKVESGPPVRKTMFANSERLRSSADLVGRAPVVVLTPDEKIITSGPPTERRRFLSMVLSQASHSYLEDELEYRRALKQRNAMLSDARQKGRSLSLLAPMLDPWTTLLKKHGARIMARRAAFCAEFRPRLMEWYQLLSDSRETPSIEYQPMTRELASLLIEAKEMLSYFETMLESEAAKCAIDEIRRGSTLFGPHRDEVALNINPGQEAKQYASQGQHKTLLVAMKLAEFEYLRDASHETPMLLLDDVFSELDEERAHQLLDLAESGKLGQTFITSTEKSRFEKKLDFGEGGNRMYQIRDGEVAA